MSRWDYDIAPAPPYEAIDLAVQMLSDSNLFGLPNYLASSENIFGHEEPVEKPARWIFVREFEQLGGTPHEGTRWTSVYLHIVVAGDKRMINRNRWHAAMHNRIASVLVGKPAVGTDLLWSEVAWPFRWQTRPTPPQYEESTDTYESFSRYAIALKEKPLS